MRRFFSPATNPVSSTATIWWSTVPSPAAATGPPNNKAMSRCARRSIRARGEPIGRDKPPALDILGQIKTIRERQHVGNLARGDPGAGGGRLDRRRADGSGGADQAFGHDARSGLPEERNVHRQ